MSGRSLQKDRGAIPREPSDGGGKAAILGPFGRHPELYPDDTQNGREVKEQEELYGRLREELTRRYSRLADLSTATRFGLTVDRDLFRFVADHASGRAPHALPPQFERWLDEAAGMAAGYGFFHFELEFPEVFFDRYGRPLGGEAGFDAVVGNPPYVRQESLREIKPYLASAFPETYDGKADFYVYFYQQGLKQTRAGGRMGYIVTNKWLRAGYGEPLRRYFAASGAVEKLVDFGHADVFPDADVFPCILILHKPGEAERDSSNEREAEVASFPREELRRTPIAEYVAAHAHRKRHSRFSSESWSLEPAEVDDLMDEIRRRGTPLAEFAGIKTYRGVTTGLNDAFLIDTATKERLVREDPRSREIIKPYLRGQDIKRWSPDWRHLWMIFARRGIDIDAYPAVKNHLAQYRDRLEPKPKDPKGSWKGRKPGSYKWYEIQDSIDYYELFEKPKIVYQEIQFHPSYCFDTDGYFLNNKASFVSSTSLYVLAVLTSPLMWWHNWRYLPHMKDEALAPLGELMVNLPIAEPTDEAREEAETAAGRLTELRREDHGARRETLDWLRVEFGVDKPGQKLTDFAALDEESFVEEVRKRRAKSAPRLSPAALKDLRKAYADQAHPLQDHRAEAAGLERGLSDLVNAAYGLTEAETELLWRTAPPRMPRF